MKESFYIIPIILTIVTVIAALYNIYTQKELIRKEKIATETFLKASKTFSNLNEILNKIDKPSDEVILEQINFINIEIKTLFDRITDSNCRSTIKVIVYDDNVPMIISLMSESAFQTQHRCELKKSKLFEDEYMSFFLTKHQDYYINNNLASIDAFLPVSPKSDSFDVWKEYYLSSLIIPIKKTEKHYNKDFIYGFLSIESNKKNAFNRDLHVIIANQICTYLLPQLAIWTKKMITNNSELISVTSNQEFAS